MITSNYNFYNKMKKVEILVLTIVLLNIVQSQLTSDLKDYIEK